MTVPRPIRFGLFPGVVQATVPQILEVWQRADEMGWDTAWVPDHFYAGYGDPEGACFEAWTLLTAAAARTKRIGLGPMVMGNTYRHPAVLANMAATLDHVAEGRLTLGIGAGWMQSEHDGYGIPLPAARERLERLDEAATVIRRLLTERRTTFSGRYYQLRDALCEPKPYGGRRLPLLIGGGGEKLTLRVVAKHADEWNGEVGPSGMRRKLAILREHCRVVGRDPDEIAVSVLLRSETEAAATYESMVRHGNPNLAADRQRLIAEGVSPAQLDERLRQTVYEQFLPTDESHAVDRLNEYVAVGVTHFITIVRPPYDFARLERFLSRVAARVGASHG
jgi:F420-dependent oxidoreductase-like protein